MPVSGQGWEILVQRRAMQERNGRFRTIGTYAVLHDGVLQARLQGASVETKGPGDNATAGNGRRLAAGVYPLATHGGAHYATIGYVLTDDPDQTPKPGLELRGTGHRFDILIHPGHGFLASVGCLNLTDDLATGADDTPFVDSRDRVIAVINDLRAYAGAAFPHYNDQPIAGAHVILEGEP